ncbi:acyl-CoA dehydrogenase family protein [Pseudonocardia acidicola]|uniref:Acyl-CoA dehydrogenase n=1 Tax=Pseudonocardia acidicola TaxID=2724939 RepID=A0ABX1SCX7_9PSEU|nr:acyl-CoA dehydrogenase family protein [Pseudonocardia acidicola]NMH98744.1 acyl-CoA dehydrogenase [Pseudonocardia acidicola]
MTELVDRRPSATLTGAELVQRATDLVPLLRANAAQAHGERRIPRENLRALEESGILRATRAVEYGGSEIDTQSKITMFGELARGCGSTAWVATLYSDADFIVSHFPDEVQREIFSDPNVHCTATLVPTARAERDGTGFRVSGKWPFNTGCLDGTWVAEPAVVELEAGKPEVCLFLLPYAELTILDDWHVSGLRGTGSNSVVGENVFVPEERMLRLEEFKLGFGRSENNKDRPIFRIPAVPYVLTSGGATFPGLAKAAMELFLERLPTRGPIAYTGYGQRSEAPITHHHVAEASMKIRSGDHLMRGAADIVSRHAQSGDPYEPGEIPEIWGMVSYSTRLFGEAVETLRQASGASGIHESQPIQLVSRDAQALATHAVMMPATGIEIYGRSLCGLAPNTPML